MLLMMETSLRAGEALALRWYNVQLENERLFVRTTVVNLANKKQSFVQDSPKGLFSNCTILLTSRAIEILQQQSQKTEWAFPTHIGERLSYEALHYQTICSCKETVVEFRGEHMFRYTFATNCNHKTVNIKIHSRLFGHANVNITASYLYTKSSSFALKKQLVSTSFYAQNGVHYTMHTIFLFTLFCFEIRLHHIFNCAD